MSIWIKPRTTVLERFNKYDPYLDNSFKINEGLYLSRKVLLEISKLNIFGCEFLDTISPQYLMI